MATEKPLYRVQNTYAFSSDKKGRIVEIRSIWRKYIGSIGIEYTPLQRPMSQ